MYWNHLNVCNLRNTGGIFLQVPIRDASLLSMFSISKIFGLLLFFYKIITSIFVDLCCLTYTKMKPTVFLGHQNVIYLSVSVPSNFDFCFLFFAYHFDKTHEMNFLCLCHTIEATNLYYTYG